MGKKCESDEEVMGCELAYRKIDEAIVTSGPTPYAGGEWEHVTVVWDKGPYTAEMEQELRQELTKRVVRVVQCRLLAMETPEQAQVYLLKGEWLQIVRSREWEPKAWMDATFAVSPRS